jgi:hypothetical protein
MFGVNEQDWNPAVLANLIIDPPAVETSGASDPAGIAAERISEQLIAGLQRGTLAGVCHLVINEELATSDRAPNGDAIEPIGNDPSPTDDEGVTIESYYVEDRDDDWEGVSDAGVEVRSSARLFQIDPVFWFEGKFSIDVRKSEVAVPADRLFSLAVRSDVGQVRRYLTTAHFGRDTVEVTLKIRSPEGTFRSLADVGSLPLPDFFSRYDR